MPRPQTSEASFPTERVFDPTTSESARYTYDMLISLKKIRALQKEAQLMRLIDAAAAEARALSKAEEA